METFSIIDVLKNTRPASFCDFDSTTHFVNGKMLRDCKKHKQEVEVVPYYINLPSGTQDTHRFLVVYQACPLCLKQQFGPATAKAAKLVVCIECGSQHNLEDCEQCGDPVCPRHITVGLCKECLHSQDENAWALV